MAIEAGAAVDFAEVKAIEEIEIVARRVARRVARDIDPAPAPVGLALSGGGIRSAATCLGAIQSLSVDKRFDGIDYLSTVSGGGYIGACLSAAMSSAGGGSFPFGADVKDSPVVAHIRNYSNYLLPRSRSALRNWSEAIVIIVRGLLANAICVLAFLLPAAVATCLAFPSLGSLRETNFLPHLVTGAVKRLPWLPGWLSDLAAVQQPFFVPMIVGALLAAMLLAWAMLRSLPKLDQVTNDTTSFLLTGATTLLALGLIALFLDLQPRAIYALHYWTRDPFDWDAIRVLASALAAFGSAISLMASTLGKFLKTSSRSTSLVTMGLRMATRLAVNIAALVLPILIWLAYIGTSDWAISHPDVVLWGWHASSMTLLLLATAICCAIMLGLRSNGYSLHRLYRDRLSKAFLVSTAQRGFVRRLANARLANTAAKADDLPPLDGMRLSTLASSIGPYPLINAALNVQGSLAANKRGREADFFLFTPHFVGSDLTGYAPTKDMEAADNRLDLASAMAISGAAASANMGGNTIRALSPTLSLLNIRLGYYLANPAYVRQVVRGWWARFKVWRADRSDRFYLFIEMFNGLTEKRRHIYLTDGGHIENLGIYALLLRRCRLIVAVDAEADPELSCESLLKVERFARIDLGIRIVLPWEAIRNQSQKTSDALPLHTASCDHGPHIAIGRILYPDGDPGLIVYVKASLSGDEKDYILDYAQRNPAFPHETTGDQFFSEEQFEMYRALGFHMVDGLFHGDRLSFVQGVAGFTNEAAARAAVDAALPKRGLAQPGVTATAAPVPPIRRKPRIFAGKRKAK